MGINSAALKRPELISEAATRFGSQCVVIAIDAKKRSDGSGWDVYLNGGRVNAGRDAIEWAIEAEILGAGEILLTSMDRDGTKAGYDTELTRSISDAVKIPVIASGGAGTMEHFRKPSSRPCRCSSGCFIIPFWELKIPVLKNGSKAKE